MAALTFAVSSPASAHRGFLRHRTLHQKIVYLKHAIRHDRHRIARLKSQRRLAMHGDSFPSVRSQASQINRAWRAYRWHKKLLARFRGLVARRDLTLPWTTDWLTSVNLVQRDWPGSKPWLLSCSHGEGGWGPWIPNTQGSGAGGWMQYMAGTFTHDWNRALARARSHRLAVPPRAAGSWYSALGQAFAAGWAYFYDRPAGKWTGAGC